MERRWLAVLAAAALAGGCGGHTRAPGDREALDYASAYYRDEMARLLWPRWQPLTRLAARAACRTAADHYRIDHAEVYAAAFARRADRLDAGHRVPSRTAELAEACASVLGRA